MPENGQQPTVHPGFAIFCFPAGIVEMLMHISVAIMLIVCLVLSAILITTNDNINSSVDFDKYYSFLLQSFTALWIIIVTGIALTFELIYFVLRFLNIRCYNNCYTVYGILDIIRYVLLAICLLIGCAGYAEGIHLARDSADSCDRHAESVGEVDTACDSLRDRATEYIVVTVLCAVAAGIVTVSVVWEIVYVAACCNSRLPVPREGDKSYI